MRQLARLKRDVESWRQLQGRVVDARDLAELDDEELRTDLEVEINKNTEHETSRQIPLSQTGFEVEEDSQPNR